MFGIARPTYPNSYSGEYPLRTRKGFTGTIKLGISVHIPTTTTTTATIMLFRLLPKASHFRVLTLISLKLHFSPQPRPPFARKTSTFPCIFTPRFFSSDRRSYDGGKNGRDQFDGDVWNLSSQDNDGNFEPFFGAGDNGNAAATTGLDGSEEWPTAEGYKPWTLEEDKVRSDLFDIGEVGGDDGVDEASSLEKEEESEIAKAEEAKRLEKEEQVLTSALKGPNRAFGDLIAASGITDDMIDSLIALKDLEAVPGLPPLAEIEDLRYQKSLQKSSRAEIERQKEEEFAKARVRKVDDKGRAYATGRRKCSVARVWIQPGDGKFIINDKDFDVYFPILDHRAALLRPFSDTKTLGLWDVKCTVKGGGTTGQVGAILLGISRALQNWEPDLRPPLRAAGFLTRDPRMVERKKPGKAKARKSFQWVKR